MAKNPPASPLLRRLVARAMVALAADDAPPAGPRQGAGIAYVDPLGRALFLKRSEGGDHAGEWCFPGGGIEPGETAEQAAIRESREEIGALPYGERQPMARTTLDGVDFRTFRQPVARAFTPRLNEEHTEHAWAPLGEPPQPLHPGVRAAIDCAMVSQQSQDDPVAQDAKWSEEDHPRAANGQFGSGGAGATHPSNSAAPGAHPPGEQKQSSSIAAGAQAYMTPELYTEAKRLIALYSKEEVAAPLTPEEKAKAQQDLVDHLAAAHAAKPDYDAKMQKLGKDLGCKVLLAPVKGGERLLEKHVRDNGGNPAEMKDLVRGSLIVDTLDDVGPALEAIGKNFKVARTKDRFAKPTEAGYSDVLINVELPGGILGEIQVHIPEMLATKNDVGHGLFEVSRKLPEGSALKSQLEELQKRVYGSARKVADQRVASKRLRPVVSQDENSSRVNESPSLNALAPLGYGRDSSDPAFSKATQPPAGSATTGMPSTSRNFAPSGTSDSFIGESPDAPILALAEDDNHWITVKGGEGKGQPVLVSEGGVVVGGAGGNLNGRTFSPTSKSKPVPDKSGGPERFANIQRSLQNRNRSSAASIAQMHRIASNPNPRLMMAAPTMNDGAPVVTDLAGKGIAKLTGHRDWIVTGKRELPVRYAVVEADLLAASNRADGTKNEDYGKNLDKLTAINNGRTAAMIEAYSSGTANAYKDAIARAERVHGIPGKAIKAMKAPVLVRLMDAADVDEHIGDESNATQTLSLSAIEQAQNDAARFDPTGIEFNDDGTPTDASVKGFINAMPASERQSLAPNGKPTKQAIDRMMAATFSAAYGDSDLVGLMAQATDPESANLIKGMSKAAGAMAKLKDAGELDIRELVTGAAKQIINAVRSGASIKKFLKQGDLLTNSAEDAIAALLAENARSAKAIGEKLTAAAEFAYQESQRGGVDIFGEQIPTASRGQVLEKLHAHDGAPTEDLKPLLREAIEGLRQGFVAIETILAQQLHQRAAA